MVKGTNNYIVPNLAQSWTIEAHNEDATIPEGHMRVTFEIYEGSGCSDGSSLDANDVAYSLSYIKSTGNTLNKYYVEEMVSAVATGDYTVVVEFSTESFWHTIDIGISPIFPDGSLDSVGPGGWAGWDPKPPAQELVTTGPFNVTVRTSDSFTLSRNPFYQRASPETTDTTDTLPTTEPLTDDIIQYALFIGAGVAVVVVVAAIIVKSRS